MVNFKFLPVLLLFICASNPAYAQMDILNNSETKTSSAKTDKTIDVLHPEEKDFLNDYMDDIETSQKAKTDARDILAQKPKILKLRDSQKKIISQGKVEREKLEERINKRKADEARAKEKKEYIRNTYKQAPFGLFWDISPDETKDLDFEIKPSQRPDYKGVYLVKNKTQQDTFEHILAIYGTQNHLWCIYAQGIPLDDTPKAEEVLKLYKKYYVALEKKYGNAEEFFTPYRYTEELVEETDDPKHPKITKIEKENPLGGPTFLQELSEEKASLYATFENGKIGVTLSVFANQNKQSFISIDFKNLAIMAKEQEANLTELINDL